MAVWNEFILNVYTYIRYGVWRRREGVGFQEEVEEERTNGWMPVGEWFGWLVGEVLLYVKKTHLLLAKSWLAEPGLLLSNFLVFRIKTARARAGASPRVVWVIGAAKKRMLTAQRNINNIIAIIINTSKAFFFISILIIFWNVLRKCIHTYIQQDIWYHTAMMMIIRMFLIRDGKRKFEIK